jgi:hypothetical protein
MAALRRPSSLSVQHLLIEDWLAGPSLAMNLWKAYTTRLFHEWNFDPGNAI